MTHGTRTAYNNAKCRCMECRQANKLYLLQRPRRLELNAMKRDTPCKDCGQYFAHYQMEFDHVPERGPKLLQLSSEQVHSVSEEVFRTELAKCDIVCANDHNKRTYERSNKS